jgi:hypothetical protein
MKGIIKFLVWFWLALAGLGISAAAYMAINGRKEDFFYFCIFTVASLILYAINRYRYKNW